MKLKLNDLWRWHGEISRAPNHFATGSNLCNQFRHPPRREVRSQA